MNTHNEITEGVVLRYNSRTHEVEGLLQTATGGEIMWLRGGWDELDAIIECAMQAKSDMINIAHMERVAERELAEWLATN